MYVKWRCEVDVGLSRLRNFSKEWHPILLISVHCSMDDCSLIKPPMVIHLFKELQFQQGSLKQIFCELNILQKRVDMSAMTWFVQLHDSHVERPHDIFFSRTQSSNSHRLLPGLVRTNRHVIFRLEDNVTKTVKHD